MTELINRATSMSEGYIDDHIEVRRGVKMKGYFEKIALTTPSELYEIVHRANFYAAPIPHVNYEGSDPMFEDGSRYFDAAARSRRVWNIEQVLEKDLSEEEALLRAKDEATKRNLPLYLRDDNSLKYTNHLVQKPDGWEPHWG